MQIKRLQDSDAATALNAIAALKITDDKLRCDLSMDYLHRFLSKPENYLIVARDEDEPVGYLVAYLLDRIDRDQAMMVFYEISVAESHQRRGIGAAMVRLLKTYCREQGVMKMWVHTNKSNLAAVGLYQSTGGEGDPSGDEVTFLYTAESYGE